MREHRLRGKTTVTFTLIRRGSDGWRPARLLMDNWRNINRGSSFFWGLGPRLIPGVWCGVLWRLLGLGGDVYSGKTTHL